MWGFLLQTLTVSLTAALLLAVKAMLRDKLSPRWQYGVWAILAMRILLPAGVGRYVLVPLPVWLETVKGMVEKGLDSAWSDPYRPIEIFERVQNGPKSATDWLLLAYLGGVLASFLWYLASFLRLRFLLNGAAPGPREQVQRVADAYDLPVCPVVAISGLPSAFICGVFRPVLAVPADRALDDKVILHELLHLRHRDALQILFWCVCRCLHWCNPFLHLVFRQIGNDMESLCDQRVLERLEGEERRAYGSILLDMANGKYARAPGTTSLSNGGKNIARRIAAIVRFKQYPRGMALVSVCIAVVLAVPCLVGSAYGYDAQMTRPGPVRELDAAMAYARIRRCGTPAGALDTYAKGLLEENGVFLAMASPLQAHPDLEAAMRRNVREEGWVAYHCETADGLECVDGSSVYQIFDLRETDGGYTAWLVVTVYDFLDGEGHRSNTGGGMVLIPVSVTEQEGWVVEETGPRIRMTDSQWTAMPFVRTYGADGTHGSMTVQSITRHYVERNNTASHDPFHDGNGGDTPWPDGEFQDAETYFQTTYAPREPVVQKIQVQVAALAQEGEEILREFGSFHGNGWDSEGRAWMATADNGPMELPLVGDGKRNWEEPKADTLPACFQAQIYHAGERVETLTLKEVADG